MRFSDVRLISNILVILFFSILHESHSLDNIGHDPVCKFDVFFDFGLCVNESADYFCTVSQEKQNWLHSLYREALQDVSKPLRKRREIRTLSEEERQAFFNAVNALKRDTSIEPNKYDALVLTHTNRTICSAHVGSNFFGWHRVYTLLFETALRQIDKSVVLPYWDWLIDNNNVTLPSETIMFKERFLGNGRGIVTSGPFRNWKDMYGCPLLRNIASGNTTLPSHEIIDMIVNSKTVIHIEDITDGGSIYKLNESLTLEGQHNLVHDWVGSMMHILDSAPKDPVFFLHHAYVDYIWEKFRQKQRSLNLNPETDYPGTADETYNLERLQIPNRTMDCFFWMTNIQGYSNMFTDTIYTYEEPPKCPDCGSSSYLICNKELQRCIGLGEKQFTSGGTGTSTSSIQARLLSFLIALLVSVEMQY